MNNDIVPNFDSDSNAYVRIMLQRIPDAANTLVCTTLGQVDTANSLFFQRQIEKCIAAGYVHIIIDMKEVSYMSSNGIGTLVFLLKHITSIHGTLILARVPSKVLEIFQLLGFDQFFTIIPNLNDAISLVLDSFSKEVEGIVLLEETAPVFPLVVQCASCNRTLRAPPAGTFRCSACNSVFRVTVAGSVLLEKTT